MKYTAVEKTRYINKEFKRYIRSTFMMDNPYLSEQFIDQIEKVNLVKGPYISISEPFKTGKSIRQLVELGILNKGFLAMNELKIDRPLYLHQEKAISQANQKKNIVVSTGTGSGKTESFLIPIINRILKDRDEGKVDCGVQALLLYPMNALANDQRERLREILKNNTDISFGFYTGETEEKQNKAIAKYREENNRLPLENEIISREELRKTPPNILFTNYTMLEYMLLRPFDNVLFEPNNTKNWHYIVLDEAHVYKGALGIEISLLIKRLLGKINSKPKFILTSATLAQGKEDFPEVVNFAKKLTSRDFDIDSIIIGTRSPVTEPINSFKLNKSRYSNYLEKDKYINEDYKKYINGNENDINNQLYQLIKNDKNFYSFKNTLNVPMDLQSIKRRLPEAWSDEEITSLIDVVTKINSYDNFLIDIRYHTFVKALEGAHVIIKPKPKLFLKNINEYSFNEENYDPVKTHQLGLCKYCKAAYLIGTIAGNKFYKIDDEELYTNYGEKHHKQSHFLLIKEFLENTDEIENDDILRINLCNKCGNIYDADNINASKCSCGDSFIVETLMREITEKVSRTNLTSCLSCGSSNTSGVIESFNIGKDSATALVAQILYRTMDKNDVKEITTSSNPFAPLNNDKRKNDDYTKQFIAFSDSRQQASYFATYFDSIQTRFLRKRVLVNLLEEKTFLTARNLIDSLEYLLEKKDLFEGDNKSREAWITYLIDLLDVERKFSLSGLGLLAFIPDIDFNDLSPEVISDNFDGLSKDDFITLIYFIIDSMRSTPAIEYGDDSQLTRDLLEEHLQYRNNTLTGLVLERTGNSKYERAILPSNKGGNIYSNFLEKALNIDREKSTEYLKMIWSFLTNSKIFVEENQVYKFKALNFKIYNRKNIDWYQCNKCKVLTYINVNDTCIKSKCDGTLVNVNPDEINKNNYYYSEYLDNSIENIRVEEHTAQLSREKGREYQRDFKDGKINILSSSTTFEMGVDLGNLDTVYMRNVPPTPANYVQRAGRAGRRKETAAYVLTFTSNESHDYNYYKNPIEMIEGKIKPPLFEVDNLKIIDRHILSVAMSMFFLENPQYFDRIETFIFDGGKLKLEEYLKENREIFTNFISENIQKNFENRYESWLDDLINKMDSNLNIMIESTEEKVRQIDDYISSGQINPGQIGNYNYMKNNVLKESTLNVLSKYSVIPKYGFPVDTVSLDVPGKSSLTLNRDLAMAISDYAPGSDVIVDRRKYRSRYINLTRSARPLEYFYNICEICKSLSMNINRNGKNLEVCNNCGEVLPTYIRKFIKPIYGFTAEIEEINDRILKPKRTYASDYYYVGNLSEDDTEIVFGDIIKLRLVKENRLAVINKNPFFMCEACGYTELDYDNELHSVIHKDHRLPNSYIKCRNSNLIQKSLGHDFTTDVVLIDLEGETEYNLENSLLYSIIEGVSIALEIERSDISGIIQKVNEKAQIILFDTVPGGAGHVRRLLDQNVFLTVIDAALEKVSQDCCDETSSCYSCLRNFYNTAIHGYLIRGLAKSTLESLKKDLEISIKGINYKISNNKNTVTTWTDSNVKDIFDNTKELLSELNENNKPIPDYVFTEIDFYNFSVFALLIWEKEKILLVESEDEIKYPLKGWSVIALENIDDLAKELI